MNDIPPDYYGGIPPYQYGFMRDSEQRTLKKQGIRAGLCVIGFLALQELAVLILSFNPALYDLYKNNEIFQQVFEILFLLVTMSPFFLAFLRMDGWEKAEVDRFDKPVSAQAAVLAVIGGYFFCTIGNLATNYLLAVLEEMGFTTAGGEMAAIDSPEQLVLSILTVAVLPALLEEFSLRGVVMQPLRRFGDRYAVLMTAFVFAMMHGNMAQIPFAFIAGTAIGYFTVATGSIWVGIAIHFFNNLSSVVLSYLLQVRPTAGETFYYIENSVAIVAGIVCTAVFLTLTKHERLQKKTCALSTGEKNKAYLCTVPMVISMILLLVETARLIQFTGYGHGG